ncbi:MAG TPA: hypothetical protein VNO30_09435 [Kofleriaceae bacterium]|nr:hypothetical protein [Kofleriaceae bacterium]
MVPGSALSHSDPAGGNVGCSHARQWTPKLTATCDDPYPNLGRFPPGP